MTPDFVIDDGEELRVLADTARDLLRAERTGSSSDGARRIVENLTDVATLRVSPAALETLSAPCSVCAYLSWPSS
jgi:hypothetical protein